MWFTEIGAPVATPNRQNRELGDDDGGADGSGYFF
jgi:hypothetical protein